MGLPSTTQDLGQSQAAPGTPLESPMLVADDRRLRLATEYAKC